MGFVKKELSEFPYNAFDAIGRDWMLVTAEKNGAVNTMTASWGGVGKLWNEPVAFVFIRPQRFTYGFTEDADRMTLSFFGGEHKNELSYLGTKSGRDEDKITNVGFHVTFLEDAPAIEEAKCVLVCRKLYSDMLKKDCFIDEKMLSHYPGEDFHRVYVAKIEAMFTKE